MTNNQSVDSDIPTEEEPVRDIVLLIHGIRDLGRWQIRAKKLIEETMENTRAVPIRFGWWDVLSFLSPFNRGDKAFEKLSREYQALKNDSKDSRFSIVAHSFGTYLTGRLISEDEHSEFHRIILCGAVLPSDFPWVTYRRRIGKNSPDSICNQIGSKDCYPLLADLVSGKYSGASGRFGFESTSNMLEVCFVGGHGLFFSEDHILANWIPFLDGSRRVVGNAKMPEKPWYVRLIHTFRPLQIIIRAVVAVLSAGVVPTMLITAITAFMLLPANCRDLPAINFSKPDDSYTAFQPGADPRFPPKEKIDRYKPLFPDGKQTLELVNKTDQDFWLLFCDCPKHYREEHPWTVKQLPANTQRASDDTIVGLQSKSGQYLVLAFQPGLDTLVWGERVLLREHPYTKIVLRCDDGYKIEVFQQ